jgi:hypothetical protein
MDIGFSTSLEGPKRNVGKEQHGTGTFQRDLYGMLSPQAGVAEKWMMVCVKGFVY